MVGDRRCPANGGKRPSEATLSPSKIRKGTGSTGKNSNSELSEMGRGSKERGASSEPSEMGTGSKERGAHSDPSVMGTGSKERGVSPESSAMVTGSRERGADSEPSEIRTRSMKTTVTGLHLAPIFGIRLELSQNSELKITARHVTISKTECSDIDKEIGKNTGPPKLNAAKTKDCEEKEESKAYGYHHKNCEEKEIKQENINSELKITASHITITKTEYSDIDKEIGMNTGPPKLNAAKTKNCEDKEESKAYSYHHKVNGVGNDRNVEEPRRSQPSHSGKDCDAETQCQPNSSLHPPGIAVSLQPYACTPESWLHLPPLAIWQIWRSLSSDSDRVKMRLVSNEWYSEIPQLVAPRPWIVGSTMRDGTIHCINRNTLRELKLKCKAPDGCFCGSCHDYLISEAKHGCSLWNPSDGIVLPLPLKSYTKIVVLEASELLAFAHSPGKVTLTFGRPAEEGSWKSIACADKSIWDICQCGVDFYAINALFRLYRLDQDNSKMVPIGPIERSDDITKKLADGRYPDHILLADLNDKLLVIALGRDLQSVHIFKVEWLDEKTTTLVTVDDLDGCSIFLGSNQSIALNARDFPGIEGNHLYIAVEPVLDVPQTIQVYCLRAKTVAQAEYPSEMLGIPFFYHPGCFSTCE